MNKKGQGISMTYIIVAALALVVLVIIVLFFTGSLGQLFQSQKETVEGVSDQQLEIWRSDCNLYCDLDKLDSFCQHRFEVKGDKGEVAETWVCGKAKCKDNAKFKDLKVECPALG